MEIPPRFRRAIGQDAVDAWLLPFGNSSAVQYLTMPVLRQNAIFVNYYKIMLEIYH